MHKHNILRFDIPMQNLRPMHSSNSLKQIANNKRRTLLTQLIPTRHNIIQLPITTQLKYRIKIFLICKKTKCFYYIRMVQESLDLQLSDELD